MKRLKFFFAVLWRSLTDLGYYREILKARFWFSFKYLFFLIYLTSLFWGIFYALKVAAFLPRTPQIIREAKSVITEFYPADLVLMLRGGKLRTNVVEPYYLDFPRQLKLLDNAKIKHFIVIDTRVEAAKYLDYQTLFLFTSDALIAPGGGGGGYRLIPLSELGTDFLLTKDIYDAFTRMVLPYLDYLPYVLVAIVIICLLVVPPIATAFSLGARLLIIALAALVLLLLVKILKKDFSYGEIYRLSMHGVSLPILVSFFLALAGGVLPGILFFAILVIFMVLVLKKI